MANGANRTERVFAGKRTAMVTFSPYPADPRPRRAIEALLDEGMAIDLLCLADDHSPSREQLGLLNVRRIPIKHRRGGAFTYAYCYSAFILICGAILAMRSVLKRYHLAYVHNMPDVLVFCAAVPKLLGAKLILDMHDPMPELMRTIFGLEEDSKSVRSIKYLEKLSMRFTDAVITVNIACRDIFSSRSCRAEKIGVVMNSPDEKIFPLRPPSCRVNGDGLHCTQDKFVVIYHGSLVERNGLDLAVDALEIVKETIPAIELRVYGQATAFLEQVLESVRSRGLEKHVRYLGPRKLEQLVTDIGECDVGVIPNHRNAFTEINTPTRIFEYLSVGRSVIAPRTKGVVDYFAPGSLVYFEPGDAKDLARQIEYVHAHPEEAEGIVALGQRVYKEHLWAKERATLLDVVKRQLNDPR